MLNNEKALINHLKNGNEKAFEKIFLFYSPKVFNFCRQFSLSQTDAEEIVQIIFISIWENRFRIDPDQSFLSYLYTAARNQILNSFKRKVYLRGFIEYTVYRESDCSFVTENDILYKELSQLIEKTIEELPPRCREIFLLSRNQELSYREISEKLSITESTVNTQITKALNCLRKKIENYF